MALADAIEQVQKYMKTLNVRGAPTNPPDQINVYPFVVCYPRSGDMKFDTPEQMRGIHTIVIEVHYTRKDLSRAVEALLPFCEGVPKLLMQKLRDDNKWNNTVDAFENIRYEFVPLGWGDTEANTIGWRFYIEGVKIKTSLS